MPGSGSDEPAESTSSLWRHLCAIIREQTGLDQLPFKDGCTDDDLARMEATLNVTLPADYKAFLRCANGQREQETEFLTFPPEGLTFLGVDDVLREWSEQAEYYDDEADEEPRFEEKVRYVLYHPGRIPIAANFSATKYLFLDYVPGPVGRVGQLVVNRDEFDCEVVADSVTELLGRYVSALESGAARVEAKPPEYGAGYWFAAGGRHIDFDLYRDLPPA